MHCQTDLASLTSGSEKPRKHREIIKNTLFGANQDLDNDYLDGMNVTKAHFGEQ